MDIIDDFVADATFALVTPSAPAVPFVFSAPHSGTVYPRSLLQRTKLSRLTLRRSEDTFVDDLFAGVGALGAPLLKAHFPRVYVDLNRDPAELDRTMFDGPVSVPVVGDSARVAGGLGVIARIVGEGQDIYDAPLPAQEAADRLSTCYRPYHAALDEAVTGAVEAFGSAVLIDCHSMPSGAVRVETPGGPRCDVILGDRYGRSCAPGLADEFARLLRRGGLAVGRNRPYAGGYITERHGRPPLVHAIQLEVNRALYMDEGTFVRTANYHPLRSILTDACAGLVKWYLQRQPAYDWPQAAE
ncbi:N-formylglutamate amidohydrolase [Acuticoccus sp.]|uniref:N-formylglutamate amidohydrolase n=1 Tax=Acuticoccus sp. TaxID=1904378 RepID=UPI003B530563